MKVLIVYYSLTGNTEKAAKVIGKVFAKEHDVKKERLELFKPYSTVKAYAIGAPKAVAGGRDDVKETEFDWSKYDIIVVGTPVWASHPTPPINDYLARVRGGLDKKVFCFATHRGMLGSTPDRLEEKIEEHDALFLDFGDIKVEGDWGEEEEERSEKIAQEFLLMLKELPKKGFEERGKMRKIS